MGISNSITDGVGATRDFTARDAARRVEAVRRDRCRDFPNVVRFQGEINSCFGMTIWSLVHNLPRAEDRTRQIFPRLGATRIDPGKTRAVGD